MTLSRRVMMSFTVFAMFFGAGNLIFPVFLAFQAGENVIPAFLGFAISAIGLPVLALQAVTRTGSLGTLADRLHPLFSRIFTIVIYLAIGPCLAIPRTASTSCEMVLLAMGSSSRTVTFIYCTVFFAAAGLMARKPEKLSKRLGKFLSPLLILLILVLLTGTLSAGSLESTPVQGSYVHSPFSEGFLEGYQTMDAIAGLADHFTGGKRRPDTVCGRIGNISALRKKPHCTDFHHRMLQHLHRPAFIMRRIFLQNRSLCLKRQMDSPLLPRLPGACQCRT